MANSKLAIVVSCLLWFSSGTKTWADDSDSCLILNDLSGQQFPNSIFRIRPSSSEELQKLLHFTGQRLPLVSAHRGGSTAGFPENCPATCDHTLRSTFALMEIDPRYSRDGKIVVHHDPSLDRTTTGKGKLSEFDLEQLKSFRLKDSQGHVTDQSIPSLDEFIEWARGKCILVLDQKDVNLEDRIQAIEKHHAEHFVMLIVYNFKDAQQCFRRNPKIMMEVMIPNQEKYHEFSKLGIAWKNIVAFVGHEPPTNSSLIQKLHENGVLCIAGTSRNLDKELVRSEINDSERAKIIDRYKDLLDLGIDLIETDLPAEVGSIVRNAPVDPELAKILRVESQ